MLLFVISVKEKRRVREMKETRVGYATLDVLATTIKEYIDAHTTKGLYIGEVEYLIKYDNLKRCLDHGREQSADDSNKVYKTL